MIKFSAIPWIIFVPGFLFIANYTEAKNRTADMTDYRLQVRFEEPRSTSSKEAKPTGIIRRRSYLAADPSSVPKLYAKSINDNHAEFNTTRTISAEGKGEKKKTAVDSSDQLANSTPVLKPLDFNETSIRSDYSPFDTEDQSSNQFATVSPTAKEMLPISNDSLAEMRATSSTTSRVTNRGNSGNEMTRESLTLMDINGPVISQDAESLRDDGSTNSEHVRVKRGSPDSDKLGEMHDEVFLDETTNSTVDMVRKKRLNYEMLFPRSDLGSKYETEEHDREPNDEMKSSDPKYISSPPVFVESFPRAENSLEGIKSEISAEVGEDTPDSLNPVTNLTTAVSDEESNYGENNSPIDLRGGEILGFGKNEIGRRYSKHRKKRFARLRRRVRRRGGPRGRKRKLKHRRKHKKKPKKPKKPAAKIDEERSAAEMNETTRNESNFIPKLRGSSERGASHLVDELQVEAHVGKRDSGDAKSEIDVNKREISDNDGVNIIDRLSRDKRTVENRGNSTMSGEETPISKNACENKELRYYDDVHEPDLQTQHHYIETKPDLVDKTRKERAAKSFRQIKELMEKLAGKVDELETFVSRDSQERKRGIDEKKKAVVEDVPNSTSSVEKTDFRNLTKNCGDEFEAKSKSDVEKIGRGDEEKERPAGIQREQKRSTGILRRRETCKKNRTRKRKSHRKWDKWTDWSSCSVTCGKGRQIRWRHCIHDCTSAETEMEEKSCQLPACGPGKFLGIF